MLAGPACKWLRVMQGRIARPRAIRWAQLATDKALRGLMCGRSTFQFRTASTSAPSAVDFSTTATAAPKFRPAHSLQSPAPVMCHMQADILAGRNTSSLSAIIFSPPAINVRLAGEGLVGWRARPAAQAPIELTCSLHRCWIVRKQFAGPLAVKGEDIEKVQV